VSQGEGYWIDRAQSAEARLSTAQEQIDRLKETTRTVCETLGAKIKGDGSAVIDFDAFVQRLGPESALEVRRIIDEHYNISGAPGEKPKIKLKAGEAA
jgi:hypothetical protein